jgi:ribosome modulation factor
MNRIMVEEDSQPIRDVTPQDQPPRENLAQRLAQQEAPAEDKPEVLDGEIVSDKHWTEEVDTSDGFPGDDSFTQGVKAFQEGVGRIDCPYQSNDEAAVHWLGGWDQGEKAAASEDQA